MATPRETVNDLLVVREAFDASLDATIELLDTDDYPDAAQRTQTLAAQILELRAQISEKEE